MLRAVLTRSISRFLGELVHRVVDAAGLQGRFAEAEQIVRADLPANEAAANVAYLKQMLNRKDDPRKGVASGIPVASLNRPE
ncbi:hypothetical protein GALL_427500 [mine drainage metagenome]|uniref:Uncharacterized protein n=1 Tax=mine drainage metagenome TaxID=410659 RepID=A0A1J5QDI7_9ZZZZ